MDAVHVMNRIQKFEFNREESVKKYRGTQNLSISKVIYSVLLNPKVGAHLSNTIRRTLMNQTYQSMALEREDVHFLPKNPVYKILLQHFVAKDGIVGISWTVILKIEWKFLFLGTQIIVWWQKIITVQRFLGHWIRDPLCQHLKMNSVNI
jgi:hypothetical protein